MSGTLSSLIVLFVVAVVMVPVLLAHRRPRLAWSVAGLYVAAFLALVVTGSDFSRSPPVLVARSSAPGAEAAPSGACGEALSVAEQVGIIRERTEPSRVVVSRSLWEQLPEEAREALAACLRVGRPEGETAVQIVPQD